jgi:hypothetical protein
MVRDQRQPPLRLRVSNSAAQHPASGIVTCLGTDWRSFVFRLSRIIGTQTQAGSHLSGHPMVVGAGEPLTRRKDAKRGTAWLQLDNRPAVTNMDLAVALFVLHKIMP